jgi:FkbM family methyltransferase
MRNLRAHKDIPQRIRRAYARGGTRAVLNRGHAQLRYSLIDVDQRIQHRSRYAIQVNGTKVLISVDVRTKELIHWGRSWRTQLVNKILRVNPGLFLDVGANIGQTLLDYCAATVRMGYVGFEPSLQSASCLATLIDDNSLSDCIVVPVALSDQDSVLSLYRDPTYVTDSAATLIAELRPCRPSYRECVACYRFDNIRETVSAATPVGLVKIDVEGSESAVLEGMTQTLRSDRPLILCEVLDRDVLADEQTHAERRAILVNQLQGLDYAIIKIEQGDAGAAVKGLTVVDAFPNRVWSDRSPFECEFLFVPQEKRRLTQVLQ